MGTVQDHVRALVRKGWLEKGRGARSFRVLALPGFSPSGEAPVLVPFRPRPSVLIPVLGAVAAGRPLLAVENVEAAWAIDRELVSGEGDFFLRVKGDSMTGAHIRDGDYLLVRPQPVAEPGEIVVVRIEDEVTVKRLWRKRGKIELHSENSAYPPIVFSPRSPDFEIIGKALGILRRF